MIPAVISHVARTATVVGKWRQILRHLVPFSRRHRRTFFFGTFAALIVVAARLAIPRLFHEMVRPWFDELDGGASALVSGPHIWQELLLVGGLLWLILFVLGLADFRERLNYARFAIGTVRDVRAAAFKAALNGGKRSDNPGSAELVARLVGDTARMKAGLKGFLVHVATNGVLYLGGTIILLTIDVWLGCVFAVAGLLIAAGTTMGAAAIFDRALRYRIREGRLALTIQDATINRSAEANFGGENRASADLEAAVTRIQGQTTWFAHAVYGAAVVGSLAVGLMAIGSGRLTSADLLLFVLYAMTLRAPTIQLARQGARTGKILACGQRLVEILAAGTQKHELLELPPLQETMELVGVRVRAGKSRKAVSRLGPMKLRIRKGQHILLVGKQGAGKTTLLEVLAGRLAITRGKIRVDGVRVFKRDRGSLADQVGCVGPDCTWPRQPLRHFLGIEESKPSKATIELLKACRAWPHIRALRKGLDSKVFSSDFSPSQRFSFALAKALLSEPSVLLIDAPLERPSKSQTKKLLRDILRVSPQLTLIYACRRPIDVDLFDRIVQLDKGRVVYDGSLPSFFEDATGKTEPST